MTNSAESDQLASSEANWSRSTLFAKAGHVVFSKSVKAAFVSDTCQQGITLSYGSWMGRELVDIIRLFQPATSQNVRHSVRLLAGISVEHLWFFNHCVAEYLLAPLQTFVVSWRASEVGACVVVPHVSAIQDPWPFWWHILAFLIKRAPPQ